MRFGPVVNSFVGSETAKPRMMRQRKCSSKCRERRWENGLDSIGLCFVILLIEVWFLKIIDAVDDVILNHTPHESTIAMFCGFVFPVISKAVRLNRIVKAACAVAGLQ